MKNLLIAFLLITSFTLTAQPVTGAYLKFNTAVKLYSEGSALADVTKTMRGGTVDILRKEAHWLLVERGNTTGWIISTYLEDQTLLDKVDTATQQEAYETRDTRIWIGMSEKEVRNRWGAPDDISTMITVYGTSKTYQYNAGSYSWNFVYFDDGICTSIHTN
jgi:hypothetical protein